MRTVLFTLLAALAGCSPPPPPSCCGQSTTIARGAAYVATIAGTAGGPPTEVRVTVTVGGKANVSFIRDGHQIVQSFDTISRGP